ncbi:MAG: EAL domain-containing protein [Desulfovibrionaceae bacterium]|nr:EAL domain-containing protein [Desulfovibrionaceae bacterium]
METQTDLAVSAKQTLLVVEDNDMNREILTDLLSDEYNVLQAYNGFNGLDVLKEHYQEISLILLDIFMPDCNGFEFLAHKKEEVLYDSIPVIVLTSSNTVDDEIRCLELGASDFLAKPYNTEVMKNRIRSTIRLRDASSMLNRLEKDSLTGLYSKEFFNHEATNALDQQRDRHFDLLCCDIENFRRVNDRFGAQASDEFLKYLARRLTEQIPGIVAAGRMAGDVFAVLLEHQDLDWNKLVNSIIEPNQLAGVAVKYGLVKQVDHTAPIRTLLDRAIMALEEIKGHFKVNLAIYDEEIHQQQVLKQLLIENMETSLNAGHFHVYYQPKHDLKDDSIIGAEALVRWIHPELGFISPGKFIPIFEDNGFITQLDHYVWEQVCIEIRHCLDIGFSIVPISVNISRVNFENANLADEIISIVDNYKIDHSLFHIEVTESVAHGNENNIIGTLQKLHDNGFIIELDDFGSGYSSLAALTTLSLDVMKLDISVIRKASELKNYSLVRYAILLAESMKLKSIAEGVETDDQVAALRVLGCDYIQGHYYSAAMPKEDFEPYLLEHETSRNDSFMGRFF